MRSMMMILNSVQDGRISTIEEAAAMVEDETKAIAAYNNISTQEARKVLLAKIGYATRYLSHKQADHLRYLFNLEEPKENT